MRTRNLLLTVAVLIVAVILTYNSNERYDNRVIADDFGKELVVGIDEIEPNVIISEDGISGFDIDIWEAVARDLDLRYRYEKNSFKDILRKLDTGELDVGLSAITINEERDEYLDFPHHYMDSGLKTVVRNNRSILIPAIKSLFTASTFKCIGYLLLFILVFGHILWFAEMKENIINDDYFPGIFEAIWCVIATMTTVGYGDIAPRRWVGRFSAFIVMMIGIGFFGFIISQLSANLTVKNLETNISSYRDLRGKKVGTKDGTTSVPILEKVGANIITFGSIDEAYDSLLSNDLDAVVFDAPSVLYFSKTKGKDKVTVLEETFDPQYYGIALKEGSLLREKIGRSLLKLMDSPKYEQTYNKWFK